MKALEAAVRLCIRGLATQDVASADVTSREHRACALPSAFCVQMWRRGHFLRAKPFDAHPLKDLPISHATPGFQVGT